MTTTSYFSFTKSEKEMINKMLQLSSSEYSFLEKELDCLLDSCKMCDDHQLPYSFYNDEQFFCSKCLDALKPKNFRYIEEDDKVQISQLEQNLIKYEKLEIPQIKFEDKAKQLNDIEQRNQQQRTIEDEGSKVMLENILKKRKEFLEVQEFISHISIEKNNRKTHDELHNTDALMKPKFQQEVWLDNSDKFDRTFKNFFQ